MFVFGVADLDACGADLCGGGVGDELADEVEGVLSFVDEVFEDADVVPEDVDLV